MNSRACERWLKGSGPKKQIDWKTLDVDCVAKLLQWMYTGDYVPALVNPGTDGGSESTGCQQKYFFFFRN